MSTRAHEHNAGLRNLGDYARARMMHPQGRNRTIWQLDVCCETDAEVRRVTDEPGHAEVWELDRAGSYYVDLTEANQAVLIEAGLPEREWPSWDVEWVMDEDDKAVGRVFPKGGK